MSDSLAPKQSSGVPNLAAPPLQPPSSTNPYDSPSPQPFRKRIEGKVETETLLRTFEGKKGLIIAAVHPQSLAGEVLFIPAPFQECAKGCVRRCEEDVLKVISVGTAEWMIRAETGLMVKGSANEAVPTGMGECGKTSWAEEEIRRSKLNSIMRMKEDLEKRLLCLNENAEVLQQDVVSLAKAGRKDKEYAMSKEELEKKEQEAYEFVQKQWKEDKERKRKLLEKKKREEVLLLQKVADEERLSKEREAEMRAVRKEVLAKNFEIQKQKRETELKKQQEQSEKFHTPSVYLYQLLEERYKKEVLMPMLEDKKQKLAEKRNILKPVTKEELEAHRKLCDLRELKRVEERKSELQTRKESEEKMLEHLKQYQTVIADKVRARDNKDREDKLKKVKEKMAVREKMLSYACIVKEVCPVVPSEEKAIELQNKIAKIKHPVKQKRDVRKQYELAILNRRNAHSADHNKELEENKNAAGEKNACKIAKTQSKGSTPRDKIKSPLEEKIAEELEKRAKLENARKHDYLAELRMKRSGRYKLSKPDRYNWSVDLKNTTLAPTEKRERVERKARMIEEQAKQKEQLFHLKGGVDKNLEMGEYVSDMFLDAVKAKLAILDSM